MTLIEIFSKKYLFDPTPSADSVYLLYFLLFFSLLIVLSIIIKLIKNLDVKIKNRQFISFLTCGLLGLVYVFGRYEQLPWLGSRLFLSLVLLTLIIWIAVITVWMFGYTKELDNKKIIADKYEKYLPKKKK